MHLKLNSKELKNKLSKVNFNKIGVIPLINKIKNTRINLKYNEIKTKITQYPHPTHIKHLISSENKWLTKILMKINGTENK